MSVQAHLGRNLNLIGGDAVLFDDVIDDPDRRFNALMHELDWAQESITVYGRPYKMPRLTTWMGDVPYRYSGLTHAPVPWSGTLVSIRNVVEELCVETFNGVLGNLYRDGRDSMGWHADDEASLGKKPVIASVNLGQTRTLRFKPCERTLDAGVRWDIPG